MIWRLLLAFWLIGVSLPAAALDVDQPAGFIVFEGQIIPLGTAIPSTSPLSGGSPADPTGTNSATQVMMGLGGTCKFTPALSSRAHIEIQGVVTNDTSSDGANIYLRWGTGTAPANGAADTGNSITVRLTVTGIGTQKVPFYQGGVIAGLTVGTPYWFDLVLSRDTGGTASVKQLTCNANEVL